MRILVIADYRGELTEERFYTAGEYEIGDTIPQSHADALVEANRATVLDEAPEKVEPAKTTKRRKTGEL